MKKTRSALLIFVWVLFLSGAWVLFSSSLYNKQGQMAEQSAELKLKMAQKTLGQLYAFPAPKTISEKGRVHFVAYARAHDVSELEFVKSESTHLSFLDLKKAFLDVGKKKLGGFFTFNKGRQGYFVRVQSIEAGAQYEFVGFDLKRVLNAFQFDVESSDWFLFDSKKSVLASPVMGYVGQTHTLKEGYKVWPFSLKGQKYKLAVLHPKESNLIYFQALGVLGLICLGGALWGFLNLGGGAPKEVSYAQFEGGGLVEKELDSLLAEANLAENVEAEGAVSKEGLHMEDFDWLEKEEEDVSSFHKMVDLSGAAEAKNKEAALDYDQFLMDDPVLEGAAKPVMVEVAPVVASRKVKSAQEAKGLEAEELGAGKLETDFSEILESSSEDWLQLAEELSKNIDEYAETLKPPVKEAPAS